MTAEALLAIEGLREDLAAMTERLRELEAAILDDAAPVVRAAGGGAAAEPADDGQAPRIDGFAVSFDGRRCVLNGILFRLLAALLRRPGWPVAAADLALAAWGEPNTERATIRQAASRLRAKLRAAGLSALAAAIDGTTCGAYAVLPIWLADKKSDDVTEMSRKRHGNVTEARYTHFGNEVA